MLKVILDSQEPNIFRLVVKMSKWLAQFDLGGIDAIKPKKNKTIYTAEFKYNLLITMQDERLSLSDTAFRFGISSPRLVGVWRKIYQSDGMLGLEPKSKGGVSTSKNKHKYIVDKPDHKKTTAELQREKKDNKRGRLLR